MRYTVQARDVATGRSAEKRFYVKTYADERGARTHQGLQALYERADASRDGVTVGRPIAYVKDLSALVQEEAPGISLHQILLADRESVAAVRKVARAVAAFNQEAVAISSHHASPDEAAALKRSADLLRWGCPQLRADVEAIVGAIASGRADTPRGPTHGDLKPEHFLLDDDRISLLDLHSFALADPVLDPATVLAQLSGLRFRVPVPYDRLRIATRAFAEEYFARAPRAWRSRLPLHYAGAILNVAVSFFRRQEPRWPDTIASMVQQARDSLTGKIW